MTRSYVAGMALVVVFALLFIAGCKGHGGLDPEQPAPGSFETIDEDNQARLTPLTDAALKTVRGTLKVVGLTIADEQGLAVPADKSSLKLMARLVDPGDDILSEIVPGGDGSFILQTTDNTVSAKLDVEFKVEEDLNGDGEGGDQVSLNMPITLRAGFEVRADITISLGSPSNFDQALTGGQGEPAGELLLVEYNSVDGKGEHHEFYGLFPQSGLVVYDKDGDEFLEPGDDLAGTDTDSNGWIDQNEVVFSDPMAASSSVEGIVTGVSIADREMTLKTSDNQVYLAHVDPFASIEIYDQEGKFIGLTSLGDHLVGRSAHVEGVMVSSFTIEASWVVINESK